MQLALSRPALPILRPYQQVACNALEDAWASSMLRMILVLPTGAGKTECAGWLSRNAKNPLLVTHRKNLAKQGRRRLGINAITVSAMRARQRKGRGWPFDEPDLVIWDEVHHGDSPDWQAIFDMMSASCRVLGLTATPWRFTHGVNKETKTKNERYGKGLGDLFDGMIIGVRPSELVRDGYLVPLEVINVVDAEDRHAQSIGGLGPSYDKKQHRHTGRIKADSERRLCAYSAWRQYGQNRKTIVYSHLVGSAEETLKRFREAGVPSDIVHGKIKDTECERRLAAFARGDLQVLINCMQLTEGTDVPDIGCGILDRGCQSLNTYVQICGRVARPAPGKTDGIILDLTGASVEHGHPQKDQDYWVVTAEARNVSDMCCTVCGTRVSPMFPTRCMRCDPFIPVVGARAEILDCGGRIYSRLKSAVDEHSDDTSRDEAAIEAMAKALELEDISAGERVIAETELAGARARIERRAREAEARAAAAKAQEEAAAKRVAELEAQRLRWEAQRAEAAAAKEQATKEAGALIPALTRNIAYARSKQWSISWAAKRTRDERFKGVYDSNSFDMPPAITEALRSIDQGGELRQYELDRMLSDQRTAKFGAAWCRKKVNKLFGI